MPLLRIQTNAPIAPDRIPRMLREFSSLLAAELDKPIEYVQVLLEPRCEMAFAGTIEPAAFVEVRSLGLAGDKPKRLTAAITRAVNQQFGIPANRIFLNFFDMPRQHWGWNGKTFS